MFAAYSKIFAAYNKNFCNKKKTLFLHELCLWGVRITATASSARGHVRLTIRSSTWLFCGSMYSVEVFLRGIGVGVSKVLGGGPLTTIMTFREAKNVMVRVPTWHMQNQSVLLLRIQIPRGQITLKKAGEILFCGVFIHKFQFRCLPRIQMLSKKRLPKVCILRKNYARILATPGKYTGGKDVVCWSFLHI